MYKISTYLHMYISVGPKRHGANNGHTSSTLPSHIPISTLPALLTSKQRRDDAHHQCGDEPHHGVQHVGDAVERLQSGPAGNRLTVTDPQRMRTLQPLFGPL